VSVTFEEPVEARIDEYVIEDIIKTATGWEAWDENDHADMQISPNGTLIVAQTKPVHA
jgi:hypothetical protein